MEQVLSLRNLTRASWKMSEPIEMSEQELDRLIEKLTKSLRLYDTEPLEVF